MDSNFAEEKSSALRSGLSRQNAGFINVPFDDGSRQLQVKRNLMMGNETRRYTAQSFVPSFGLPRSFSELDVRNTYGTKFKCICIYTLCIYIQIPSVVPFDDGSQQHPVERNLMVENETEHYTAQGFDPSSHLLSSFSELVPSNVGSRQLQGGRNLMLGNGTRHTTAQGFVPVSDLSRPFSELVPSNDGNQQLQIERNLMVENVTRHYTAQGFVPGPRLPHPSSEVPSNYGSRQLEAERNMMVGNGTGHYTAQGFVSNLMVGNGTGRYTAQGFVSNLRMGNRTRHHTYQGFNSNLMVGNGTGQHTGQGFTSSSTLPHSFSEAVPEHDDISRQLPDVSPSIVGNGKKRPNTEQDRPSKRIRELLGESTPKAATNQPGKTMRGKRDPEYYRERRRKQNAEREEMKSEMQMLRKGNIEYKTDLENKNREADALGGEVQLLKESVAECRETLRHQRRNMEFLKQCLLKPLAQPGENARLRGEITRLQGEVTRLQGEVTRLQGEITRLQA